MGIKLFKPIFDKKGYKCSRNLKYKTAYLKELAKEIDEVGFISQELGIELESLFDEDYVIGIHRTGYSNITGEVIEDVFNNGLINNQDNMLGVNNSNKGINTEKTITFLQSNLLLINQLKAAHKYKTSEGVFLVKIPKASLDRDSKDPKPIYFENRLLPEYIYGYIPVTGSTVHDIIKNDNYQDIHDYQNDGLIFDSNVNIR